MRLFSKSSLIAATLLAGLWTGVAQAASLAPPLRNPIIGGVASFEGDLSPSGEVFALVQGDLSSSPVFNDPDTLISGGNFLLSVVGTPGIDLAADFIIDGVGGDFDPNLAFLSGVLEDFAYDDTLVTLIFGGLDGEAASLFGSRVLVSFFDFGGLPQAEGTFSGIASYTIQSIAPIPLPLTGVLLLSGLGGLTVLRRRRVQGGVSSPA